MYSPEHQEKMPCTSFLVFLHRTVDGPIDEMNCEMIASRNIEMNLQRSLVTEKQCSELCIGDLEVGILGIGGWAFVTNWRVTNPPRC